MKNTKLILEKFSPGQAKNRLSPHILSEKFL